MTRYRDTNLPIIALQLDGNASGVVRGCNVCVMMHTGKEPPADQRIEP
jgi:hypothetical protein